MAVLRRACEGIRDGHLTRGEKSTFSVVGAISLTAPTSVRLACQGNNVTTFDLSNITIRTHNLG